ncbi:MAG: hypothetical protein NDJ24_00915 [Alphaproteobacteria bacterium]|nr:hypothetical protein [Alphaproteobacteria bacterium]
MRLGILTIAAVLALPILPVLAQSETPALLDSQSTLTAEPSVLDAPPDLNPTIVDDQPKEQVQTAPAEDGKSVIAPYMEPWQKREKRTFKGKSADQIFQTLPVDSQNQILDESQKVFNECHHYKLYSQFHDCECLGSTYFEERVFSPEKSRDAIMGKIAGECTSEPGVAAYGHDQCLNSLSLILDSRHMDEFCKCYALTFAKNYKDSPYPDFQNLRAIGSRTNTACLKQVPNAVKMPTGQR